MRLFQLKGKKVKKTVNRERKIDFVFSDEFVAGSVKIQKKAIRDYVFTKGKRFLGDDFYYAYTYRNGILKYVALKTDIHVTGKLSVFSYPLLYAGNYCLYSERRGVWYKMESTDEKFQVVISKEKSDGYLDLKEVLNEISESDLKKLPVLRWSLEAERNILFFISIVVFLISIMILTAGIMKKSNEKSQVLASSNIINVRQDIRQKQECKFFDEIVKVTDFVRGKGVVKKLEYGNGKLDFVIEFDSATEKELFMKNFQGARDEGKTVYYTVSNTGC